MALRSLVMTFVKTRRFARELVLQGLYAAEMAETSPDKILEDLMSRHAVDTESREFMERLFNTSLNQEEWIRTQIEERLENWDITRVAIIDLLVLHMMIAEMVFLEDIPPKVSIAEGVEIARKYSTDESSSFVNGILDSVYHSLEELPVPGE